MFTTPQCNIKYQILVNPDYMYSVIYNFLKQTVHDKLLSIKIDFVNTYFLKANMHKLFFLKDIC